MPSVGSKPLGPTALHFDLTSRESNLCLDQLDVLFPLGGPLSLQFGDALLIRRDPLLHRA
jgi:hypothetical protein